MVDQRLVAAEIPVQGWRGHPHFPCDRPQRDRSAALADQEPAGGPDDLLTRRRPHSIPAAGRRPPTPHRPRPHRPRPPAPRPPRPPPPRTPPPPTCQGPPALSAHARTCP